MKDEPQSNPVWVVISFLLLLPATAGVYLAYGLGHDAGVLDGRIEVWGEAQDRDHGRIFYEDGQPGFQWDSNDTLIIPPIPDWPKPKPPRPEPDGRPGAGDPIAMVR